MTMAAIERLTPAHTGGFVELILMSWLSLVSV